VTYPDGPDDETATATCPYLGLADDAESHATYATDAHRCYRLENPTRIAAGHQDQYCLSDAFTSCPVYQGQGIAAAAPRSGASPAAAAPAAGAARSAGGSARRSPFGGGRSGGEPGAQRGRPSPERPQRTGTLSPRPRPGGISLPVATIGLFVLAVVVIALAFWIQSIVGGNGDGNLTPADQLATQQALASLTPAGGARTVTPGPGTGTPTGTGTPATPGPGTPTRTPSPGNGARTYTIASGDNCSSIAEQFDVSLQDFLRINNLTEETCQQLQIGQVVRIP
jgi:hypothetical protein